MFCAASVVAFRWTFDARNVDWELNGITPPPIATLVLMSICLVLPLARLGHPSSRLMSTERPLALLEMTPKLWRTSLLVSIVVPARIRWVQLPYCGERPLLKFIVPVVTIRLNGLFRRFGNMVEPSSTDTGPIMFPPAAPFYGPGKLPFTRTTFFCGLCKAPRAADAMTRVHGNGPPSSLVVTRFVGRVTLTTSRVFISLVTLCT